jgi:transposase-like protein
MNRLTEAIERLCAREEVGGAVRLLVRSADEVARTAKEILLQGVIDREVTRYLGKRRAGRPRPVLTPWRCRQCGPRLGSELRRNGHYLRRPLACEGIVTLRIPQLRCQSCGRSVAFSHPLLPRRKRLWLDLDQQLALLYLEGCSYRASRRLLERKTRSATGLMTLWRSFIATGSAAHAPAGRPPASYLALDEVHHRVRGEQRWFLSVRAQDAAGGKHWVGSVLSNDRSQEAWQQALVGLGISRYNPPFAVLSDGDQAIEAAVSMTLPGVRQQRCTWHLKHNAAEWIRERHPRPEDDGQRRGLMAAVHVIVDAPSLAHRQASLEVLREPFPWLARNLARVLDRIPPKDCDNPIRTNNLMERGFRELRRRTRQMDGFGSDQGAANFHLLWMLKENARLNGRDYLAEIIP